MSDVETTVEVSEEDVQQSRDRVQQLREELAETQRNLAVSEASRTNAVRKARLDREADSLEQQLQAARDRLAVSQGTDENMPSSGDNKSEWEQYASDHNIDTTGMTKAQIEDAVRQHQTFGTLPSFATTTEADVRPETGEVNPDEVERLTADTSDEDEDKE